MIYIPLFKGAPKQTPKIIVLHAIAQYIHIDARQAQELGVAARDYPAIEWLKIRGLSVHRVIDALGQPIKCREDNQGAYHAAEHNTDSLGIEFMVPGVHDYASFIHTINETNWFGDTMFTNGINEVRNWMQTWNISVEGLYTHYQLSPDRKQDPGKKFPLEQFLLSL